MSRDCADSPPTIVIRPGIFGFRIVGNGGPMHAVTACLAQTSNLWREQTNSDARELIEARLQSVLGRLRVPPHLTSFFCASLPSSWELPYRLKNLPAFFPL
jgi:hypothetical protein